ncbi:hypothetical protein AV758_06440 [Campylobacter coli]|nr:hypothetical protein [Campylobacter coli]
MLFLSIVTLAEITPLFSPVTTSLKTTLISDVGGKIKCRKRKIKCRIFATNYLSFNLKLKL